jgi:GMP reductase
MAGNVATPEKVTELIEAGVDIVKVGLGSGANCTTRYVTGCGVPQLSAIIDCVEAARVAGGLICSDGGITCPGDVMKALGAGANFVMVGSEFAGHDESGGKDIKECYGMSSGTAMKKFNDTEKTYRSSEGRTSIIPYRGPLKDTIDYYLGGLRSGMTYIGAESIRDISVRTTFIKVSNILNTKYQDSTVTIR